uniref:Uncharacterized protein n=1 Tax=Ditylenchus dipsaci TaxID=166011 RepID=A0A915CN53_9BILA
MKRLNQSAGPSISSAPQCICLSDSEDDSEEITGHTRTNKNIHTENLDVVEQAVTDTAKRRRKPELAVECVNPLAEYTPDTSLEEDQENLPPANSPRVVQPRKACNYYMSEHRYRIRKLYPHLKGPEVNSYALKEFQLLSDKSRYNLLADQDIRRYEQELESIDILLTPKRKPTRRLK